MIHLLGALATTTALALSVLAPQRGADAAGRDVAGRDVAGRDVAPRAASAAQLDVRALLGAARGAPPAICALAARSVGGWGGGWGGGADAPATPLGDPFPGEYDDHSRLPASDVERLVEALATDDP